MKFPVNSKTRFYAGILCFIFVLGGAALVLYGMLAVNTLEKMAVEHAYFKINETASKNITMLTRLLKQFNLGITIVSITGFLLSLFIFVSSFRTRIGKYNRIIDRLNLNKAGSFSLSNIHFPEEDEFGNLGTRLNKLISAVDTFDSMKREKLLISNTKMKILGTLIDKPIAVVTTEYKFSFANQKFNETFNLKDSRENYKINAVFDNNFEEIISNTILKGAEIETRDSKITTTNGQIYKCGLTCTPIFTSDYEVSEIFILFQEVKKQKK